MNLKARQALVQDLVVKMNDNAELYSDFGDLQRRDADYILKKYSNYLKFGKNAKVLDIGTADGTLTSQILFPKLPQDLEKLIGFDIAENMVNYAKKKCQDLPKLDFVQMDITCEKIPLKYYQSFDNIFSFYCLNWVPEESFPQTMKNIYDLLKPGGQAFITIVGNSPLFDFLKRTSLKEKWAPIMSNVDQYLSIFHKLEHPEVKLEKFVTDAGFESKLCTVEHLSYVFPNFTYWWDWAMSINPFIKNLSENEIDLYREDYMKEVKRHKSVTIQDGEKIAIVYTILVVCASKP